MKHDDRANDELLEVIELAKKFLEQEKQRGLQQISVSRETWGELEAAVERANLAAKKKDPRAALDEISKQAGNCTRCSLSRTRTNVVVGEGNPEAKLMFIGEAPGADEDEQGLPFVGRAGQLLTRIIEAIKLKRSEVYICNILKCRPPENRNPETDEIAACEPFLFRQIASVKPRVICALGTFGAQTLLRTREPISRLRGYFMEYRGAKLLATFHPAYLLRNPNEKRRVWEDMKKIRAYLQSLRERGPAVE